MARGKKDTYFFYNHHTDLQSTIDTISAFLKNNVDTKVHIAGFIMHKSLTEIFNNYRPDNFVFELEEVNSSVNKLQITKSFKSKNRKKTEIAKVLILQVNDNFSIFVSIESLKLFKTVVLQFLSNYYIEMSRAYLDSGNLRNILSSLKQDDKSNIISRRIIAYQRKSKNKHGFNKKSAIIYTSEDFLESFDSAIDSDQFIDKIDFTFVKNNNDTNELLLNGHLGREGVFWVDNNFSIFYRFVILKYAELSMSRFNLLQNRERKKEEKFEVKPLEILYSEDVFEEKSVNHKFIGMLKEMSHTSLSCYHANPYININMLDYLDGSSVEMWVIDSKKIILVPQTKCTSDFLSRLINYIFENFREGVIKNFEVNNA